MEEIYKGKNKEYLTIVSKEEGTSTPCGSICFSIWSINRTKEF